MLVLIDDTIEHIDEQALAPLLDQLPAWRREQALRFKHLSGRRECTLSYLLLCRALREEYGITALPHFVIGEHGKPSLHEFPHIHFNLSHCRNAVLCAVSRHAIGVDIERRRSLNPSLIGHTMNEAEQQHIMQTQDPEMEFIRLWTAKEAVVKLTGEGLTHSITDILNIARSNDVIIETTVSPNDGYAYSVARYVMQ